MQRGWTSTFTNFNIRQLLPESVWPAPLGRFFWFQLHCVGIQNQNQHNDGFHEKIIFARSISIRVCRILRCSKALFAHPWNVSTHCFHQYYTSVDVFIWFHQLVCEKSRRLVKISFSLDWPLPSLNSMICDRYSLFYFTNCVSIIIFRPNVASALKNIDEFRRGSIGRMCRGAFVAPCGGGSCRRHGLRSGCALWACAPNYGMDWKWCNCFAICLIY